MRDEHERLDCGPQFAAVVAAGGALWAAVAASYYASLTRKMLEGQREQTRLENAPILNFAIKDFQRLVANVGRGPALNVFVTSARGEFTGVPAIGAIPVGKEVLLLPREIEQSIQRVNLLY